MKLERTTTGLIIHNPDNMVKRKVLQYFSLVNPLREYFIYSGNDRSKPPIFGLEHDVIYISSGFLSMGDQFISSLPRPSVIQPTTPQRITLEMNREPRSPLQEDCIRMLTNPNNKGSKTTVELKPGTGKREPYSRKIPTPTEQGYTLMGDLKVGDYVFDRTGNLTRILQIFEHGEQDVYKITFQDGRIALCGPEHLWTVKSHKNGIWKTVETRDMLKDFKRVSPWKVKNGRDDPYAYKYYIPMCQPVQYPHKDVPVDPWVLGCFIGNGCCTLDNLTISSGTNEIPHMIAQRCGFKVMKHPSCYSYIFYNKETGKPIKTAEFFKDIPEMINCYSRDKKIPELYMINDPTIRLELVKGLLDTDGSIAYAGGRFNVTYSSCSLTLLKQLRTLMYSLGYTTGKIKSDIREDKYVDGFCGEIFLKIPNCDKTKFFSVSKKFSMAAEAKVIDKENIFDDLLIKDISFSHREQCRCIMVDNPEHLYLTEDFIVTHNTFIATYAISKIQLKPLIVAPTSLLKNQWCEEFEGVGVPRSDIATDIYDAPNRKVCVVTISSIENELRKDWKGLMNVVSKSGFGIKVVDEAHLHLKGILKFDAICNIKYNWYLSATLGRSDVLEDNILNRALSDAQRFVGNAKYEEYQKQYVNVYFQDIYYYPSNRLCAEHFKYGSKGLIKATYYNMLMDYHHGIPFLNNLIYMMKVAKKNMTYDAKVLLLVPLLSIIDKVQEVIQNDPFFTNYSVSGVDGSMSLATRRQAMESDFILSTTLSMGTGVDVKNLGAVVNFDQFSSPIIVEQIYGRLRDRGKETWYYDITDHVRQARMFKTWGDKRRSLIPYFPGSHDQIKVLPDIKS